MIIVNTIPDDAVRINYPDFNDFRELFFVRTIRLNNSFGLSKPSGSDGARSRVLYERIGSKEKTLKLYEGLLHEIFNEPEHPVVMADLEAWLKVHAWKETCFKKDFTAIGKEPLDLIIIGGG